jgi:hypothetical protein
MAPSLTRHAGVACFALALVLGVHGPTLAGEPQGALVRAAHELLERHEKCEASLKAAKQRRYEASRKPYLSDQDRQKDWRALDLAVEREQQCLAQAAADLQRGLAALEIQAQKDFDGIQTKLPQVAAGERPGLEKDRSETVAVLKWARFQRLQREQLEKLKTREGDCEQGANNAAELIKSNTLRPPGPEGAASTIRANEMYEQERKNFLACAENARKQQAEVLAALSGRGNVGTTEGRAAFERDVQGLLRVLQQEAAQLANRQTLRYEEFTVRMARLGRDLETFKERYAQMLADKQGQPLASRLVQAGELVVASATTWKRAAGLQDSAQRDAVLRDVSAQWQRFQSLVRESADLAARGGREESGQASPATR